MKTMIRKHSKLFINPGFLVIYTPVLLVTLFLLTKSYLGTIYLHIWLGFMTTSLALLMDEDLSKESTIVGSMVILFIVSLFEVALYLRVII